MHQIIEIFPKLAQMFPKTIEGIVWFGMSIVYAYHIFIGNVFFNTAFEEAQGFEKMGNVFLSSVQYLCEGKEVHYDAETGQYLLSQRFNYETGKASKSPFAMMTFSTSLVMGTVIKSIAFLAPETRQRHRVLRAQMDSSNIRSNNDYYRSVGIQVEDFRNASYIDPPEHQRRPGSENHLMHDKAALKEIVKLLSEHEIPFWVDCGTCLGAYRYGGIIPWDYDLDIAVIEEDFENVKHALNGLDQTKFVVQDWSNRGRPNTYLRVYVRASRNHIDIYHNAIDVKNQTLTNILSQGESEFMADCWKIRERMFVKPVPFDLIFPLKKAHFDGIDIPVPRETATYLTYKYGPNISPAKVYSEETDEYEKDLTHPYWGIPLAH